MHGKSFENMIKAANGVFTLAAADRPRSPNQMFDIDANDDHAFGFPTSIKTTKAGTIGLSDARQFWHSFNLVPYRILIGRYWQDRNIKVFDAIHEIILQPYYRADLLGEISEAEINDFHEGLKAFGPGREQQRLASAWAQEQKRALQHKVGFVALNPKIDSKNQRRLQCSVTLTNLASILRSDDQMLHREVFGKLPLPLRIVSGQRKLKPREEPK